MDVWWIFYILSVINITEGIFDVVENTEKAVNDEDNNIGAAQVTEQIMDPNIKMNDAGDRDDEPEEHDPNWDPNLAVRDIAYYLRAHKFSDYDHRYYKEIEESPRKLYEEFPKPPLRSLHWEVHRHCDDGFIQCLKYLDKIVSSTPLKRIDDTVTIMRDNNWNMTENREQILSVQQDCEMAQRRDNLTFAPFQGPIERFQWRTSASYYMCWYTMLGTTELALFGERCDNYANCLTAYGVNNDDPRADDSKPFACAMYSFCPDHCCPMKHIWSMNDCYLTPMNICYQLNPPGHRKCTMNREDNQDFHALMGNQLNVSCECHVKGYEWSSKFGLCVDINECSRGLHNCSFEAGESCFNLPGNFQCVCGFGFVQSKEERRCMISDTFQSIQKILKPDTNKIRTQNILSVVVNTLTKSSSVQLQHLHLSLLISLFSSGITAV